MTRTNDQLVAAFDALVLAVQSTSSALEGHQCIFAALSPGDLDKSLRELNSFSDACIAAGENHCVLMYALII